MRSLLRGLVVLAIFSAAAGCRTIDETSGAIADSLAPPDPVTGERTLNIESEQSEVEGATARVASIVGDAQTEGVPVDKDTELLGKLRPMLARLAPVSHRPQLPWEVHVLGSDTVNAFAIGGGKMFFFSGIRELARTDAELAAVLAHEMAHNTCRHITEQQSIAIAAAASKSMRQAAKSPFYGASYSVQHEDEADRVSMLYLALAGYDPGVVPGIWANADRRWGSDPGNFTYNHSLNSDRAGKTASNVAAARAAYAGPGVTNPAYETLRLESPLLDRQEASSGFLALLETIANTLSTHAETVAAAKEREEAARKAGQLEPKKAEKAAAKDAAAVDRALAAAVKLRKDGKLAEAEAAFERVLARDADNHRALYNLACIAAVQGREKRALNCLDRAVEAGFGDAAKLKAEPDLECLRATPKFKEILKKARAK